jgi:hypothetical protein
MAYKAGWAHHRDAKPDSFLERLGMRLNEENRRLSRAEKAVAERQYVESMRSAPGGRTPARRGKHGASEPMTAKERRAADKILKEGKQPRGRR